MANKQQQQQKLIALQLSVFVFIILLQIAASAAVYNVASFGARADGKTDSTKAFLRAWRSACSAIKPSTIQVPGGRYVIKQITFSGPCRSRINFRIDGGTLLAPSNIWSLGNSDHWILFTNLDGVSVFGGVLDGRGARFWACRKAGKNCPVGARSLTINDARNFVISDLTSVNSQMSHIAINECNNVMVTGVKIVAPDESPNTDGIAVQLSTGVTVVGSNIKTGDDCISIGPGTQKMLVDGGSCGPGHGISIGSLAKEAKEAGVQNVTVRNVVFTGTENGLRIKSWARPSNSFVTGIVYQNIVMNNVSNPIIIDQRYCPGNKGCPNQQSGTRINQVTYQNVRGTSATPTAVRFHCSATNPCRGIKLRDIRLTNFNKPAQSFCMNAYGTTSGLVVPGSCL